MAKPLDGIRVLEWAGYHNGPAAGYMLGDLGADVIKIEEPGVGDPLRGMMQLWGQDLTLPGGRLAPIELADRSKRSIALNLKHSKGREVFYRLVEQADVFLTNYHRNDILKRLEIDYDTLRQYNPRLIYAVNSCNGPEGPLAEQRGFDLSSQARSGMMWGMGDPESQQPTYLTAAPCDQTGATLLAFSIITALLARERLGIGQRVDVSLYGAGVHLHAFRLNVQLLRHRVWGQHPRTRIDNPLTNYYRCRDGKWLFLGEPQPDRFWHQFCAAVGIEELEADPRFVSFAVRREHAEELIRILDNVFATRTRDEWVARFSERGAEFAYSPIFEVEEAAQDPQAAANDYIVDFDHPVLGPVKFVGLPMKFSATPAGVEREAPELGQHTEEILLQAGYTWEDIAALKDEGAIG